MAETVLPKAQQPATPRLAAAEHATVPLAEAIAIMARLRGPGGCPWDREQTFDSIKRHTLEETYEVFDAIERRAWPELKDELGDLLLQVLFYSQMASEAGYFDIADVASGLNAKLVRRHPHIFPVDGHLADATDADAVLRNWEQIKQGEKRKATADSLESTTSPDHHQNASSASALNDIPRTMPAMLEAAKIGSRASKAGFDWPNVDGLFEKLQEEIAEVQAELKNSANVDPARVEEELGDLLFTAVNLARHLKVDAESALRSANAKFRRRFAVMEANGGGFDALGLLAPAELEALWEQAKFEGAEESTMNLDASIESATDGESMSDLDLKPPASQGADATNSISITPLTNFADFERCVDLQVEVWGYSESDLIPKRVFIVAQRIGGQVLGAFDESELIGFAMSFPGYREGKSYMHSHMLAVREKYRNVGLGRRLKMAQRADALARGLDRMEWTFDPLEIKNAHLNIARLGAIARRYHPNFYGQSTSPLQGGLPTDRLVAEWWLRSNRVRQRLGEEPEKSPAPPPSIIEKIPPSIIEQIEVPHAVYDWKRDAGQRKLAEALQTRNRIALESAFARGLAITGYERTLEGDGHFLLTPVRDLQETLNSN